MFVSGDFGDKSLSRFLKNLKFPSFYSGNLKIFKNALEQFIPNRPPKQVITSINCLWYNIFILQIFKTVGQASFFFRENKDNTILKNTFLPQS